ncbi:MAG TPA: hypothetical protein VK966_12425, partial [Longimicrobiales bacterium]|nr:hypothetical protein [Longimicrobiales bacterium]
MTMHLTDADLIRHLDGEGEIARRQVWTEHMEGCVICAHRFRDMERTSETFSSLLRAAEFEVAPGATGAAATANAAPPKAGVFETGTGAATLPAPDAMPGARP